MTVKLSSEQITALGGLKDASEFGAKLETLQAKAGKADQMETENKTQASKIDALSNDIKKLSDSVSAFEGKLSALDASVKSINPEAIIKQAKEAASIEAGVQLGKVGAAGAGAANANVNEGDQGASNVVALEAAGKWEEAWAASAPNSTTRKEFSDPKVYAAYKKAESKGQVRIK